MKKTRFASCVCFLLGLMMVLSACSGNGGSATPGDAFQKKTYAGSHRIVLSGSGATLDGKAIEEFDYTWHCDPSAAHEDVKDAPAEYYTGEKPETDAAVYIDHELYYYPELPESGFQKVKYDGEDEWAYYYTDGVHNDYIFATLPCLRNTFPSDMMHSPEEAAKNKVLHITQPGIYVLEGTWNGQIRVDLSSEEDTFTDENAKVTIVLDGVDINCTVAPGILFSSAYECDNRWESRESWSSDADISNTGVSVIVADRTENNVRGTNVFRMLKTKYKDENSTDAVKEQKKMRKIDAAFYSCVSMKIDGEEEGSGKLTVTSGFEGMDSELHLEILGGNIVIESQDDGMNVNENHVSVIKFSGGNVTLNAAQGEEGDGVDSNGYIVLNGGSVSVNGVVPPDSALDSEDGVYYRSGSVVIDGQQQSYEADSVFRETGGMGGGKEFGRPQNMPDFTQNFDIKSFKEQVAALDDNATLEDVLSILGISGDMRGFPGDNGQMPPDMPNQQNGRP